MVTVLYFASIKEQLGLASEIVDNPPDSVFKLRTQLCQRGENWNNTLMDSTVQIAVDQQLCKTDTPLKNNSEVAFFPPVTGG